MTIYYTPRIQPESTLMYRTHNVTTTATINNSRHVTAVAGLDYDDEGSGYKGSRHAGRYVFSLFMSFSYISFFYLLTNIFYRYITS